MRILHLSSEYPPERVFGLGRYVHQIAREQARQGHAVHVLTNSIGGADPDIDDGDVQVHRVAYPPPPKPPGSVAPPMAFNLHLQQRAADLGFAGAGEPEVVVSHDWLTAPAAHQLAKRWHIPHVWTVHDTVHGKTFGRIESPEDEAIWCIERWAAANADLALINSNAIRDEVREFYGAEPEVLRLVHCGVDPAAFVSTQAPERLRAFRQVFAAPDELLITYTGRLDREKGIDTLVNAFAQARRELPSARLAIVGKGALDETIRKHIAALGLEDAVTLYGYLAGTVLRHFYQVSDLHVCPSHYEPFGIVALEAMAAGAPVVVSATGGLTDIVDSDAVGRSFPPRDATALAAVLVELGRDADKRRCIGRDGRAHAARHFSWDRIARLACAAYGEALSGLPAGVRA